MASNSIQRYSSSSSSHHYDVFVSFRGDVRYSFMDHLFAAFQRKGIVAFRDDTKLEKGESIAPELVQAIQGSQILIVVFSKNYASSTWCLRELAKILDCLLVFGKRVLPVFYDVDPSEVRKQSGGYRKAFAEHEESFNDDLEKLVEVKRWREALTQVANLAGWEIGNKPQYAEIEKIVEKIISILGQKFSSLPNDLVGMQSQVEELERLLHLDSVDNVRVVGICGMGGIGKTTLARVLYDKISDRYKARCFIDVSEIYRDYGHFSAQRQLLCQILSEDILHIGNLTNAANLVRCRLQHLRSLIVLDNVYQVEQLEKLAVKCEWLGAGSRIILISRDEHILKESGVDAVYDVQFLKGDDSLQLFCRKAFKCEDITMDYQKLTYDVIRYAKGLPLALKVLGSFLFGRNVSEWKSALVRLRENPSKDIMDVLRLSFDGLEEMEKEIFLDIACFFNEMADIYVKKFLDIRGFYPEIGLRVLIDKSLITMEEGKIYMHDLLEELGRSIVREKSPKEPWKWSRLWKYKDLQYVMLEIKTAENLEAIVVKQSLGKNQETTMRADALSKMNHLKLLWILTVEFSGSLDHLSNELGYLNWDCYPFTCLPSSFQPNRLVELILTGSNMKQLWESTKALPNLTYMDLSHSKNLIKIPDFREAPKLKRLKLRRCIKLIKMPDFGKAPNLEWVDLKGCIKLIKMLDFGQALNLKWLNFKGCIELVQIDPSIGLLRKLTSLNMKNCKNLVRIPNSILGLSSLQVLNLSGCSKLLSNQLLEETSHVKHLKMSDTREIVIPSQSTSSIWKVIMFPIHFFYSRRNEDSVGLLWPSLPSFPCLCDLDLSFCNLVQIPNAIGSLRCLQTLNLGGNNFTTLPSTIKELSTLAMLNLEHCKQLKYFPELPSSFILPIGRVFDPRGAGLYIFDCPKLVEMEQCCSIAFAWMIRGLQVPGNSTFCRPHVDAVIPGRQIPLWFKNQMVGSSISMGPNPRLNDNNWIGVAFCVAFVAHDQPSERTNLHKRWESRLWGGLSCNRSAAYCIMIPVILKSGLVTAELDHLWLLYYPKETFTEMLEDVIKFRTDTSDSQDLHFEVKRCGFRWVFKQDLEQLNAGMMYNKSSSSSNVQIHDNLSPKLMRNHVSEMILINKSPALHSKALVLPFSFLY